MNALTSLSLLLCVPALTAQAAPTLGAAFAIGNAAGATDKLPRVAYDFSSDRYCVAWSADNGTAPATIFAQVVNGAGSPIGAVIVVSTNARLGSRPAIANISATDKFLVGWTEISGSGLTLTLRAKARSLDAGTGALSTTVEIGAFTHTSSNPLQDMEIDIGGDRRTGLFGTAQDALVVWTEDRVLSSIVRCRHVQVPSTGAPVPGTTTLLQNGGDVGLPQVTRHCGFNGRWGVIWPSGALLAGQPAVRFSVVDSLGLCSTHTLATMTFSVTHPSVATADGVNFAAAWSESSIVHVMPFSVTGVCPATLTSGAIVNPFTTPGRLIEPALDFAQDKYVLACRHRVDGMSTNYRVLVKNLDPSTCASCGVEWFAETSGAAQESPATCAKESGSTSADDQAIVVWANGTIRGRRFEATTTSLPVNMGGACGTFGFNDYATYDGHCVLGNDTFSVSLAGPTSPILALIVGFSTAPLPCGPCTLIPSMDLVLPGASPTVIPIPCLPGLIGGEIYTQWLQWRPSGCPILPDLGTSNTLKFTIVE